MKAIIQRVTKASVTVGEETISSIGKGLCVLIGISKDDGPEDVQYMARKILNIRLFDDESGKAWSKSVMDTGYEVLFVSQFTLTHILKGNKPDFHQAMPAEQSQQMYEQFLQLAQQSYKPEAIKDGKFQAYMQVHIQNDGPITIPLDSPPSLKDPKAAKKAAAAQARMPKKKSGGDDTSAKPTESPKTLEELTNEKLNVTEEH